MTKILVIEDEQDVRDNIPEILFLSGYQVSKAPDGRIGLDMALSEQPDVVICDITMPGLDGYEVLSTLHRDPGMTNVPFIFLTASHEKEHIRRAMSAGADDYLTKPFEGIDLLRTVESCLKKQHLRQTAGLHKTLSTQKAPKTGLKELLGLEPLQREIHSYRKKQQLFMEGQRPSFVYYVVSGKIKIYRIYPDGKEFITLMAGPGDFIGYSALTESLTRTLSDFRTEKLIDIRDGKIYLLNKGKLANLAN